MIRHRVINSNRRFITENRLARCRHFQHSISTVNPCARRATSCVETTAPTVPDL